MIARSISGWVGRYRAALAAGILGAVAVSIAVLVIQRPPPPPRIVVQQPTAGPALATTVPTPAAALLVVHMSGEVLVPGVYQLPVGARVDDAVRAAGGVTLDGDVHRLNLAARLADGQHLIVPRKSDPVTMSATSPASPSPSLINVNTATVAELDGLPGVGPVTAQRIVAYREQHGPFTHLDELRDAKLVNAATLEKIRELITL